MHCLEIFPPLIAQSSPGLFTYFHQSNFSGQLIVVALVAFSLIAWTLMIGKYYELKRLTDFNQHTKQKLAKAKTVVSLDPQKQMESIGPFSLLIKTVIDAYMHSGSMYEHQNVKKSQLISHIENGLQRQVAEISANYESKMTLLSSIVSGAPFLGLLGTVWGVMDAFGQMALQSSATLQHLAPGVSGALLTTVAALLVAIPSVFGYNYLVSRTKQMVIELENFASCLADRVELEMDL